METGGRWGNPRIVGVRIGKPDTCVRKSQWQGGCVFMARKVQACEAQVARANMPQADAGTRAFTHVHAVTEDAHKRLRAVHGGCGDANNKGRERRSSSRVRSPVIRRSNGTSRAQGRVIRRAVLFLGCVCRALPQRARRTRGMIGNAMSQASHEHFG